MRARKVLVVDDEKRNLELVKGYLDELGIEAVLAEGGKQGLHLAKSVKPDAILLDLMMPDMPGEKVAEALGEDPETSGISIIFLTSLATAEDTRKDPRGNYKFLSKWLIGEEFPKKLEEFLLS